MMKKSLKLVLLMGLFILTSAVWAGKSVPLTRAAWVPGAEKIMIINSQQRPLLWDLVSECPYYFHRQHEAEVNQVVVSNNARLAATATKNKKIKIWDVATGAEKHEIVGFDQIISAMVFRKNPRDLLLADRSGEVRQWNLESYSEQTHFKAFDSAVTSMGIYNQKKLIALGSENGEILVWDMQLGKDIRMIRKHKHAISAIKFSHNGRYIFSAGEDGQILIWDYSEDKFRTIMLKKDAQRIHSLDVSPDGQYILVASDSGMMFLIDAHNAELLYQVKLSKTGLQMATFKNNFEALLVDQDNRIWSFDVVMRKFRAISEVSNNLMTPQSMEANKGQNWVNEQTKMAFTWVEGGCFSVGCNAQGGNTCSVDNSPSKNVCVDGFWMGKEEVTAPQWAQVMGQALEKPKIKMNFLDKYVEEENDGVVVASGISWKGGQDFVCRLNKLAGGDFRLPTEVEWEYACDKTIETQRLRQPNLDDKEFEEQQKNIPTDLVNIKGMHSSVSEWVLDIYKREAYREYIHYNPLFLNDTLYYFYNQKVQRVKRGGGWEVGQGEQECIVRQYNSDQRGLDPKTGLRLTIH